MSGLPINHHRSIFGFAHPFLQYGHRGRVATITGKDFVCFGKTLSIEHQPYNHLFTVGPGVARITELGFGITEAQALEIGRGQMEVR